MKIWLPLKCLRAAVGIAIVWGTASPAEAVQQSNSIDRAGFTCNVSFGSCACDGTYENCNAMEKSCKDQKIACTVINDQRLCTCLMATESDAAPAR